jgi:hypothetical protein
MIGRLGVEVNAQTFAKRSPAVIPTPLKLRTVIRILNKVKGGGGASRAPLIAPCWFRKAFFAVLTRPVNNLHYRERKEMKLTKTLWVSSVACLLVVIFLEKFQSKGRYTHIITAASIIILTLFLVNRPRPTNST